MQRSLFYLAVRSRQTKRILSFDAGPIMAAIAIKSFDLIPEGMGVCSNRRLSIGTEEISLSDLRASAVKPGGRKDGSGSGVQAITD
jgi:hypothetical protein